MLLGEGGGFGSRVTRLGLFQPDEIVVDLPDEIDKDRLFDVAVAAVIDWSVRMIQNGSLGS